MYVKSGHYNTDYYRRNKTLKFCVHRCPCCNYETTGPKSSIQHHIWAKHTPENEKPFECPCANCPRRFASKANLLKHLKSKHNIILPKYKRVLAIEIKENGEKKIIKPKNQNEIMGYIYRKYMGEDLKIFTREKLLNMYKCK